MKDLDFTKAGYTFKYFFDADVDSAGHIDIEGYDVYHGEELVAELQFYTKEELEEMSDSELKELVGVYTLGGK